MQGGVAGDVATHEHSSYTGIIEDAEPVDDSGRPYPGNSYSGICSDNAPAHQPQANGMFVSCMSNGSPAAESTLNDRALPQHNHCAYGDDVIALYL